tara:strand:+ start:3213 stop:3401 length:189 start_codon:yes stop_codon:yes gene_type:complete
MWDIIVLYLRCKRWGCLPYPGALVDQPADVMEYFDIIDIEKDEMDRIDQAQQKANARQRGFK